jgi:hypothetical protein
MKKFLLLLQLSISNFQLSIAQAPLVKQWDYRFGGFENESLIDFKKTADGGYILAGYCNSDSSGNVTEHNRDTLYATEDYWMLKTDASGNKQWDKRFGGSYYDYIWEIQQTADGGYILGGKSHSGANGDKTEPSQDTTSSLWQQGDYWIVKTDSLGNKQWDKTFGGCDWDELISLQQTPDGGYILGGSSNSDSCGDVASHSKGFADFWVVKTDAVGNMQWQKRYGGSDADILWSLKVTPDGGYIFAGTTNSDVSGDVSEPTRGAQDFWLLKTDAAGAKQWDKRFGGNSNDQLYDLKLTNDGGYIIAGSSLSGVSGDKTEPGYGGYDGWVVKTDALGNKQWDKDFGGTGHEEWYPFIYQTNDNGYLFSITSLSDSSGNKTEDNVPGPEQTWVVKTDSLGTIEWDKTLFIQGNCAMGITTQADDGCYVFANFNNGSVGYYKSQPNWDPNNSSFDFWMIKFCDTTLTTSVTQLSQSHFTLYPNPAGKELKIKNAELRVKEVVIYDLFGRRVLLSKDGRQKSEVGGRKSEMTINISSLSPGIYLLKAGNEIRKFVKE